jgi:peptide/nickel transport system ATP-binding protein/oligopeptide transport system ATP-binding protein
VTDINVTPAGDEVPEAPAFVSGAAAPPLDPAATPILEVRDLKMYFPVKSGGIINRTVGHVQAVDGISFQVPEGTALGLVGESGCGKSTTGRLITRLYDPTGGSIKFDGKEIATIPKRQMLPMRRDIQMIFQDPATSLNPRHSVGSIIAAPLHIHKVLPEEQHQNVEDTPCTKSK